MSKLFKRNVPQQRQQSRPLASTPDIIRESGIKTAITHRLGTAIKCLQQQHIDTYEPIYSGPDADNVCHYLEAVFIHGLKDTFFEKMSAILTNNPDKSPEPNFWPLLLIVTHKDILSQINNLSQLNSDIGRCRAWIRVALNDGLLDSYMAAIIQDHSTMEYYYKRTAYLRDDEQPDILRKYIEGLGVFQFKLACNSHMLNVWSMTPLILAGVWSPPVAPEPVVTGVDVALCFDEDGYSMLNDKRMKRTGRIRPKAVKQRTANSEPMGFHDDSNSSCGGGGGGSEASSVVSCPDPMPSTNHQQLDSASCKSDDMSNPDEGTSAKRLLEEDNERSRSNLVGDFPDANGETLPITTSPSIEFVGDPVGDDSGMILEDAGSPNPQESNFGNSLTEGYGWSSSFLNDYRHDNRSTPSDGRDIRRSESVSLSTKENEASFQELLQNYSPIHASVIRTPDFSDSFGTLLSVGRHELKDQEAQISSPSGSGDERDYEILPQSCSFTSRKADPRTQHLLAIIGKISNEVGLDVQNYKCNACGRPIGMIYGKARVCNYDGHSYCYECHENEENSIPARIVHNWDFKKYKVCKLSKIFLQQIEEEPLIDVRQMNIQLYSTADEMNELQLLRTQLSYLRSYLFSCRESVAEEMRRKLWPREYLYEHVHLYSLSDLLAVPTRSLAQLLGRIITKATHHIQDCLLCSQKGFICEICNNSNVIYPYELEITHRCETCLAVYHKSCMNGAKPCPKCDRRRKRLGNDDFAWDPDD